MIMSTDTGYLPRLESRESYVDHLECFATAEIGEHGGESTPTRIKTYMLETARYDRRVPDLDHLFPGDVHLHRLDDTLYRVEDGALGGRVVGLIEALDPRHPVLYTTLPADRSDRWVRRAVDHIPWLDRLWLSSPILFDLWKYVQRTTPDHRYVRLGFEHEAWYETPTDLDIADAEIDDEEHTSDENGGDTAQPDRTPPIHGVSHRAGLIARHRSCSRSWICTIPCTPWCSYRSPGGERGGHRFHHDGRATNWSESFVEHRAMVDLVVRL